jgi:SET domain-containing protein
MLDSEKVEVRASPTHGAGLFAAEYIRAGERIASFDGKFYSWQDTVLEIPNTSPDFIRDHAIQFDEGQSRDSFGFARMANHSCSPNCGIQGLFDLRAMRPIAPGEEITWDYAMTEDNDWSMQCKCGSEQCRRIIKGYRWLPIDRRKAYRGFISDWLLSTNRPYVGENGG